MSNYPALHPRPDSASRKPRVWLWILAAVILGVLMLLVAAGTWQVRQQAGLGTALAEIARSGEPATAAELEAFYIAPPADQDATQLWLDGSAPLVLQAFQDAAKDLPIVGRLAKVPPPGTPWSELEAAEDLLKQYQSALALLHQAAALGGGARYPTKFAQGAAMPMTHAGNLRSADRLLALEAHVRAHRGDARGAAQSIETMLGLGRSLENEPLVNSLLLRMACDQFMARQQLNELLPHVPFADQDLIRLQGRLEQIEYESGLRRALLGERVISQQELKNMPGAVLFRAGAQQVHLDFMQRMLAAAQHPFPRALEEVKQIRAELKATSDAASRIGQMKYHLTAMAGKSSEFAFLAVGRSRARNDATIAAIAIERYRRQHGALPSDLTQLVPDFLRAVPFDPFSGRPLKYVLSEDEYLIYNVGADGIDNGGQGDDTGKPDDVLRIKVTVGTDPPKT